MIIGRGLAFRRRQPWLVSPNATLDLSMAWVVQNAGTETGVVQNKTGVVLSPFQQLIDLPFISHRVRLA
ncbi:hypothetical protein EMIT0P100_140139 [Pseudomonas sp. IT-P100]